MSQGTKNPDNSTVLAHLIDLLTMGNNDYGKVMLPTYRQHQSVFPAIQEQPRGSLLPRE